MSRFGWQKYKIFKKNNLIRKLPAYANNCAYPSRLHIWVTTCTKLASCRHSNYNFSMLQSNEPTRALLFAVGREPIDASHALLNLLCHVSQDNTVIIVNGSGIA